MLTYLCVKLNCSDAPRGNERNMAPGTGPHELKKEKIFFFFSYEQLPSFRPPRDGAPGVFPHGPQNRLETFRELLYLLRLKQIFPVAPA